LTKSINWFVGGVVFASLIGLYQFLAKKTGVPFPTEILHTSPTYSMFEGYEIDGFPRMNATFTEAAAAAFSMTVALAIVLWRFWLAPTLCARFCVSAGLALDCCSRFRPQDMCV
jgi:hypothetical protein